GTLVRTRAGLRPIETLQAGDHILTQDTRTGDLTFRCIFGVVHRPPSETLRIDLGGEAVVTTSEHLFWLAGRGWVPARDLRAGDVLHPPGGRVVVVAVAPGQVQPIFNLGVAKVHNFFVGRCGVLVHDDTLPAPVRRPFDVEPVRGAAAPRKR